MGLFSEATITQAYLKMGLLGFNGSGKSRTAVEVAIGLTKLLRERGLPEGNRPIFFLDTETGSDYLLHIVERAGLKLFTSKTRAFKDLVPAVQEAERSASVLIIDSVTHFWREITDTYKASRNKKNLTMQDWGFLKTEWAKFTDAYVNSSAHIILCGRAGFEYDDYTDEDGNKKMEKSGVKMKAEGEMGYEPSLLVYMERDEDVRTHQVSRVGYVLKDRFDLLDGKALCDKKAGGPVFECFLPHVERINLGGKQLGVDTSRTSAEMIPENGKADWQFRKEQVEIVLDQIQTLLVKHIPGQGAQEKRQKVLLLEKHVGGGGSWSLISTFKLEDLRRGFLSMKDELEPPPTPAQLAAMDDLPPGVVAVSPEEVAKLTAEGKAEAAQAAPETVAAAS